MPERPTTPDATSSRDTRTGAESDPVAQTIIDPAGAVWRAVLAQRLAMIALGIAMVATGMVYALLEGERRVHVVVGGLVTASGFALSLHRGIGERARGWLLVASAVMSAVSGYATLGFVGGPAASLLVAVVLAALLLGRRAVGIVLFGSSIAITLVAWAMVSGRLPAPSPGDTSPLNAAAWARSAGITLLLAGLVGVILSWAVRQIEDARRRELRETSLRREAEEARRAAQQLAIEAQKRELVGRLGAGLAHDFNNHLTVIAMAHGQLVGTRASPETREEASRALVDSVRSAGGLARQLLVFGRKAPRKLEALSLAEVVDTLSTSLQRVLPSDVSLEIVHEAGAVVRADASQLQQALLNFVVNARDAMPGGGQVTVRTRRVSLDEARDLGRGVAKPGAWAVLEVEDDGTGIEESVRQRVFEPFFTTKPLEEGSGLGLATVAMLADEAQGLIELDTEVGRGTRIALWLPASEGSLAEQAPAPAARRELLTLRARVVLVVEDEPLLLEAALRVLAGAGCRVLAARDGTAALRVLAELEGGIDLLCTDVVMPGARVRDVIERFHERHPGRPVLTCSGYVGEDLVRRGIEEGRYRLLQKPYSEDDLLAAVAELLQSGGAADAVESRPGPS